jgi:hypothetical protein
MKVQMIQIHLSKFLVDVILLLRTTNLKTDTAIKGRNMIAATSGNADMQNYFSGQDEPLISVVFIPKKLCEQTPS